MKFPARVLSSLFFAAAASAQTYNTHFQQVIVIVRENRSTDNVFSAQTNGQYSEPGVNLQNFGSYHGTQENFTPVTLAECYDLGHNNADWQLQWDKGKLDGQVVIASTCSHPPTSPTRISLTTAAAILPPAIQRLRRCLTIFLHS